MISHIISEFSTLSQKEYKTRHDKVGRVIHWEQCKKFKFWLYEPMVHTQPKICPGKWDTQTPIRFWDENASPNLGQTTRPNKNQRIFQIVDFAVPADHRVKLKEKEKRDNYLHLARELEKLWNMKVTFIPIAIGALGLVSLFNGISIFLGYLMPKPFS